MGVNLQEKELNLKEKDNYFSNFGVIGIGKKQVYS
jgi:hypothetical protein